MTVIKWLTHATVDFFNVKTIYNESSVQQSLKAGPSTSISIDGALYSVLKNAVYKLWLLLLIFESLRQSASNTDQAIQ